MNKTEKNIFKIEFFKNKNEKFKIKTIILYNTERCFQILSEKSQTLELFLYQEDSFYALN